MVTDSAVVQVLKEIDSISTKPVTVEELEAAKAAYVGNFIMKIENPRTVAEYAYKISTEKLKKIFTKPT